MKQWADWKLMKARKSKDKVLHVMEEPAHAVMHAGGCLPRKQIHRRGCVVVGETQLNMRPQCALEVNRTNHCRPELC